MPFRLTGSDSPGICSPFASFSVGLSGLVATATCIPARRRAVAFAAPAGAAYVMRQSGWKAIKGPSMRLLSDLLMHP